VGLDVDFVSRHAGRPAAALTRRDVARALLAVSPGQALVALPELRRALPAAGNPLSVAFWESARRTLTSIESGAATVADVRRWLESTGTEPVLVTRSYFVWPEEEDRGPVATEMFERCVAYLEEKVAARVVDPDRLATGDPRARERYEELQEDWLNTALPDGRVPNVVVGDELDEELFATWDEQEAFALAELRRVLADLPEAPRPETDLREAALRVRTALVAGGYPGNVLTACAGFDDGMVPDGDEELWLSVAAGIAGPISDLPEDDDTLEEFVDLDGELGHEDAILAALCVINHPDWLAAVTALARRGPGVLASPERIARLIAESEDVVAGPDDQIDPDDMAVIGEMNGMDEMNATEILFRSVIPLWQVLGIVDEREVLTPLGWWGLPKALERAWSPE
jgi:hypothetical protein